MRHKKSYLEGEFNAVEACGEAISEAVVAIKGKFSGADKAFILIEFQGVMLRASMLIKEKNKKLGVIKGE